VDDFSFESSEFCIFEGFCSCFDLVSSWIFIIVDMYELMRYVMFLYELFYKMWS
jgi:hypothetical protein